MKDNVEKEQHSRQISRM